MSCRSESKIPYALNTNYHDCSTPCVLGASDSKLAASQNEEHKATSIFIKALENSQNILPSSVHPLSSESLCLLTGYLDEHLNFFNPSSASIRNNLFAGNR
ncbi:MAG: hypothetical protein H0X29_10865 [Parachlamydiaceae bacterium]|nr:hypothetical protein [Parachlamydiaceae bacterium]